MEEELYMKQGIRLLKKIMVVPALELLNRKQIVTLKIVQVSFNQFNNIIHGCSRLATISWEKIVNYVNKGTLKIEFAILTGFNLMSLASYFEEKFPDFPILNNLYFTLSY